MNIFGIGIDIIEIDRIEKAIKKNPRFLERNFTKGEVLYFKENNFKTESIAGNFAAKEAISKAIKEIYAGAQIVIYETRGLCSYYAEKGGVLLACECEKAFC